MAEGALMGTSIRSVLEVLKGGVPDNVFNTEVLPIWRERFGGKPLP